MSTATQTATCECPDCIVSPCPHVDGWDFSGHSLATCRHCGFERTASDDEMSDAAEHFSIRRYEAQFG